MKNVTETVDLPDPAVQPLVHSLDLPEARRDFRRAWLIQSLANPAVCLCLAAIAWFLSESWVPPLFVFAATLGFGWMATRWSLRAAWEYIPRKRQDRFRTLPIRWPLGAAAILTVVLTAATVLLGLRLARPDVALGVREVSFGSGVAVCALALIVLVIALLRRRRPARDVLLGLLPIAGVAVGVFAGYRAMFAGRGIESWQGDSWQNVAIGAAIMVVGGVLAGVWRLIEERREDGQSAGPAGAGSESGAGRRGLG